MELRFEIGIQERLKKYKLAFRICVPVRFCVSAIRHAERKTKEHNSEKGEYKKQEMKL